MKGCIRMGFKGWSFTGCCPAGLALTAMSLLWRKRKLPNSLFDEKDCSSDFGFGLVCLLTGSQLNQESYAMTESGFCAPCFPHWDIILKSAVITSGRVFELVQPRTRLGQKVCCYDRYGVILGVRAGFLWMQIFISEYFRFGFSRWFDLCSWKLIWAFQYVFEPHNPMLLLADKVHQK